MKPPDMILASSFGFFCAKCPIVKERLMAVDHFFWKGFRHAAFHIEPKTRYVMKINVALFAELRFFLTGFGQLIEKNEGARETIYKLCF